MSASGELAARRADQRVRWMRAMLTERMRARLTTRAQDLLADLEDRVTADRPTPNA